MTSSQPLLNQLNDANLKLSKSDKKVAAIIQSEPQNVIHKSIAALAKQAEVSEPTVNRFCHKLGCSGYPDFKLRLAQELSSSGKLYVDDMQRDDGAAEVISKITDAISLSINTLSDNLDSILLAKAAEQIAQCARINFFGLGASGSVALDAQHKFFRFGMPVVAHTDFINQRMMCSMMNTQDVAVFISYTGRTEIMIENARLANENQATVIGVTQQGSPLSRECSIVLNAQVAEDTDLFTPMTSRIAHLAIIDMLATTTALNMGSDIEQNILNIKRNLLSTRTQG